MAFYLDNVTDINNIILIFRLSDAVGATEIVASPKTFEILQPNLQSILTKSRVNPVISVVRQELIRQHIPVIMNIIAIEITNDSVPIYEMNFNNGVTDFLLAIGSERHGVSDSILLSADARVHVPMFGRNSSMNVALAASIAASLIQYNYSH